MMSAPATSKVEVEPDDTTTVDIYASYAVRPPLKRAPGFTTVDSTQVLEDLQQVLSSLLGRQVTVSNPIAPNVKARRAVDIGSAKIFLALVDAPFFDSSECLEELNRATRSRAAAGAPHIFALDLQATGAQGEVSRSDIEHDALMSENRFPLASSSPDAPLRQQEAEYRDKLQIAAESMANVLRGPDSTAGASNEERELASNPDVPIWLVQYRAAEARGVQARLEPGRKEDWRLGRLDPDTVAEQMEVGDFVAVWRTVERSDRGGIIAWGKVTSLDLLEKGRFELEVTHAFPDSPIGRDQLLDEMPDKPRNWPGQLSTKRLDDEERAVFAAYLPETGDESERADADLEITEQVETPVSDDSPEESRDLLRRGPLAFALAHKINDIYGQRLKAGQEGPAFILHIDAPWGGGKTTFANFIARFLNPTDFDIEPKDEFRNNPDSIFYDIDWYDDSVWPSSFRERKWITVEFNAWRHQHVTPPWWDLYDFIRRKCLSTLDPLPRIRRQIEECVWRIATPKFWTRVAIFLAVVALAYFAITSDKLAALARELGLGEGQTFLSVIVALITGGSGWALLGSMRDATSEIVASAGDSTDAENLGTSDPLRRFRRHFTKSIGRYENPVMVIIDDLDRCDADYVVELVRGLLTVFQSPRVVFVLLGDKNWIETSFSEQYKLMEASHRDPNVSFGGRFAEKAIQMSFVLPEANPEERNRYVERLLLGDTSAEMRVRLERLKQRENSIKEDLQSARTLEDKQTVLDNASRAIDDKGEASEIDIVFDAELRSMINSQKVIFTAAASEKQEEDIRKHALAPLKDMLPVNPRRIKRLVNMIAIYQASAQAALGIEPRTPQWKRMVLWVVLMSEFPVHWRLLCSKPSLADLLGKGVDPPDGHEDRNALKRLSHPAIKRLIYGLPFAGSEPDDSGTELAPSPYALDGNSIRELRRLTPVN